MYCRITAVRHDDIIDKKIVIYVGVKLLRLVALLASWTHVRRDGEQINTYVCVCVWLQRLKWERKGENDRNRKREEVEKKKGEQGVGKDQSHGTS